MIQFQRDLFIRPSRLRTYQSYNEQYQQQQQQQQSSAIERMIFGGESPPPTRENEDQQDIINNNSSSRMQQQAAVMVTDTTEDNEDEETLAAIQEDRLHAREERLQAGGNRKNPRSNTKGTNEQKQQVQEGRGGGNNKDGKGDGNGKPKVVYFKEATRFRPSSFKKEPLLSSIAVMKQKRKPPHAQSTSSHPPSALSLCLSTKISNPMTDTHAGGLEGPTLLLTVFLHIQPAVSLSSGGGEQQVLDPIKVIVRGTQKVEAVIEQILRQFSEQQATGGPSTRLNVRDSRNYELRMTEDDDEGTPDEDMPALERTRDIHKFGIDRVALCLTSQALSSLSSHRLSSPAGGRDRAMSSSMDVLKRHVSGKAPGARRREKKFIKIYYNESSSEYNIFHIGVDTLLVEMLPMITKKKQLKVGPGGMDPADYAFYYRPSEDEVEEGENKDGAGSNHAISEKSQALDMGIQVRSLDRDELTLVKDPKAVLRDANATDSNAAGREGSFSDTKSRLMPVEEEKTTSSTFFHADADLYTSYNIWKKNRRGKWQERILGVNKDVIDCKLRPGLVPIHIITPKHPQRRMLDVVHARSSGSNEFEIDYRQDGQVITVSYRTETTAERDEIVAKVEFLRRRVQDLVPS